MDLLILFSVLVGSAIAGIVGNMIASELYDRAPMLARWIVNRAVRHVPQEHQERYEEEWLSHLDDCEGKISQVFHACGCMRASYRLKNVGSSKQHYVNRSRIKNTLNKHHWNGHLLMNYSFHEASPRLWTAFKSFEFRVRLRFRYADPILRGQAIERWLVFTRFRMNRYWNIKRLFSISIRHATKPTSLQSNP